MTPIHWITLLLSLTTSVSAFVSTGSEPRRKGQDWNHLEDWFGRKNSWRDARSLGTFWNVKAVYKFPIEPAYFPDFDPKKNQPSTSTCVLAFYYPGYWKNMYNKDTIPKGENGESDVWKFYDRPLAVSPICGPAAIPEANQDFPRAVKKEDQDRVDSIVFHTYYTNNVDTDLYYIVR
jgi:hypothetical protein